MRARPGRGWQLTSRRPAGSHLAEGTDLTPALPPLGAAVPGRGPVRPSAFTCAVRTQLSAAVRAVPLSHGALAALLSSRFFFPFRSRRCRHCCEMPRLDLFSPFSCFLAAPLSACFRAGDGDGRGPPSSLSTRIVTALCLAARSRAAGLSPPVSPPHPRHPPLLSL